jgi:hypothetical protein
MESTTKGSAAAHMAVYYITGGILLVIWCIIWWTYMHQHQTSGDGIYFMCYGCLLSGVAITGIGFIIGRVGRSARQADLPPTVSATPAVGQVQPVAGQMPGMVRAVPGQMVAAAAQAVMPPQQVAVAQAVPANQTGTPVY